MSLLMKVSRCTECSCDFNPVRSRHNIAKVAAARKLLTLVFYGLRDHEIRCLHTNNDDMVEVA
jgi:hypothetical protein